MTIVIPTFGREAVLLQTIGRALALSPAEILVVDQTPNHEEESVRPLTEWHRTGAIRWIRLAKPSIPHAMNIGLIEAREEVVLFLDDDVIPCPALLGAHAEAHASHPEADAVIGQVLQPGESPAPCGDSFRFYSESPRWINLAIACNMSVNRNRAIAAGGFDENFIGAAYQFETEFAQRLIRCGGRVYFEPRASIRHLRAERGGTRSYGSHLRTFSPAHAVGDYYHMLLSGGRIHLAKGILRRIRKNVANRHHLLHPWWIPATFIAEIRGLAHAFSLKAHGPRLIAGQTVPPAR